LNHNGVKESTEVLGKPEGKIISESQLAGASDDPEIRTIVNAWPSLPEALKAGILAMIRAAKV
jgi:hypothetical protein